jgi:predicted nucleic acid binding AN1-type Zn finger protein
MNNKCCVCQKKVKIDYYECKYCENKKFCSSHRFPFAHTCINKEFDNHKERILKDNPKLQQQKIEVI